MTIRSVTHFNDILREWQSPAMIPVVLQLLNEELNYLEGRHKDSSPYPDSIFMRISVFIDFGKRTTPLTKSKRAGWRKWRIPQYFKSDCF